MGHIYLERYAYPKQLIHKPPQHNLGIVVVIPCFNEPDLISTLKSLAACEETTAQVEVIVIVNESEKAELPVHTQNQSTFDTCKQWVQNYKSSLDFHILYERLPSKHAGVGLARKIGMDEAVRRFDMVHKNGVIAALDADCLVAKNYLTALESHFVQNPNTPACSIYFEHPLRGPLDPEIYQGITAYELHLRYYTHGLRYAGHPFAFQTVGSSMAVRSVAYQKQGGMNKRKAGEDFYFLQDMFLLGQYTELNNTTVIPSPRASLRVPFGTGKAIHNWLNLSPGIFKTYNYQIFGQLKVFISIMLESDNAPASQLWQDFPSSIKGFIPQLRFEKKLKEIRCHTRSSDSFRKRFFAWCNGFFVFKFAHFARDNYYPDVPVAEAAAWLLNEQYGKACDKVNDKLLEQFRILDRDN